MARGLLASRHADCRLHCGENRSLQARKRPAIFITWVVARSAMPNSGNRAGTATNEITRSSLELNATSVANLWQGLPSRAGEEGARRGPNSLNRRAEGAR